MIRFDETMDYKRGAELTIGGIIDGTKLFNEITENVETSGEVLAYYSGLFSSIKAGLVSITGEDYSSTDISNILEGFKGCLVLQDDEIFSNIDPNYDLNEELNKARGVIDNE